MADDFDHHEFKCNPKMEAYETEFTFLQGLGHGFVHASYDRIYFEYDFPAQHWIAFSTADQTITGELDACSVCYFDNYYPLEPNESHSNLYPECIEECLDDAVVVATVNSDEDDINNWDIMEFQIVAQHSKKLQRKMYRIPRADEILEIWGKSDSQYRVNAHFAAKIHTVGEGDNAKPYVHAAFWRKYDFTPDKSANESSKNEWRPFVYSPQGQDMDLWYSDSFCFLSIGSFYGGEYPFDDDALSGLLPGFYVDTQHLTNTHCYKLDDIKVDCGQDWSFLSITNAEHDAAEKKIDDADATTISHSTNLAVLSVMMGVLSLFVLYWFVLRKSYQEYTERKSKLIHKGYDEEEEEEDEEQNETLLLRTQQK
eukprot:122216_1